MTDPTGSPGAAAAEPIRVMIVDDHPVVRDGLRGMLGANPDFGDPGGWLNADGGGKG